MYGPKYVWFFIGWYEDNWFKGHSVKAENINCTIDQMKEAAEGHFTTEALQWNQDKSPTISGKVTAVEIKKSISFQKFKFAEHFRDKFQD